ncbi:hypothetical protein H2199_007008 [Coniosporium tulheliwenetii]|uniref:Uncharacterized protein n=1 Tax=Coniosporium tulheliwenetii TaxID=3383036 RepID=A0ACC2YT78_9PEZI|nr:hypothetical protein H2199_007008 [Cladosporium sp. JES 115]
MASGHRSHTQVQSQSHVLAGVAIAFLILAWIAVSLRLWVRGRMIHSIGWDDYTMFLATVTFTGYCVALIIFANLGGGSDEIHESNDFDRARSALRWVLVWEAFYIVTIAVIKISLGIFFMRIVVKRWQKILIWTVLVISTVWGIVSFGFTIFHCGNPRYYLEKIVTQQCASPEAQHAMAYTYAAVTCATDWALAVLPIFLVCDAKLDLRSKISVWFVLSLGFIGSICSVVRFMYLDGLLDIEEFFWSSTNIAIWSCIEPGVCIIAGSLATLRPLFKKFFHQMRTTSNHSSNSSTKRTSQPNKIIKHSSASSDSQNRHSLRPWDPHRNTATITTCTGGPGAENNKSLGISEHAGSTINLFTMNEEREVAWALTPNDSDVRIAKMVELEVRVQDSYGMSDLEVDRRSSHTLGDEERENMRLSMQPPRRPLSDGEV